MRSPVKSGPRNGRDAEAELNLPPGFRFHPTDEELVVHYLCRKAAVNLHHKVSGGRAAPPPIIAEVDLYKHDPWDLPEMALFGEKEWYFFTPRDKKYPNGLRPNRAAGSGYWKATGADKPIRPKATPGETVGIKKALVFYAGKAPKGIKTNWIMHEYRLARPKTKRQQNDLKGAAAATSRLDDWVLCRLYNKKNNTEEKIILEDQDHHHSSPSEDNHRDTDHSHNSFNSLEESDAEITYNPILDDVDLDYNNYDAGDENELEFMMKSFGAEIDYLDMMSQNDKDNDTSAKVEGEDGNGNDWFTTLSWEDLQQSLEAMPTVAPLPGDDQFSCGHKMPILDHTNQLPFLF